MNFKFIFALLLLICGSQLALASTTVRTSDEIQRPTLPPACSQLEVDEGNEVAFHVHAIGVQIYRWNGTAWDFVAPEANLFADAAYHGQVGIHSAGPIWQSNSGSWVRAQRREGCDVDPSNAIPWLLKEAAAEGPGIFRSVTFIQRVNTAGGVKPASPGSVVGETKNVPYTAEYYFYRAAE